MTTKIIPIALLCILTSCNEKKDGEHTIFNFPIKGTELSGKMITKDYQYQFNEIKVSSGIEAEIIKADVEKIVIKADQNLIPEVLVENNNGMVSIGIKPGLRFGISQPIKALIYAKDFSSVSASSSADITIKDKFIQEQMRVHASSSGSVTGNLEANDFNIETSSSGEFAGTIWAINLQSKASSSGEITLKGKSKNSEFKSSSSGTINAKNLESEIADLHASSSGSIMAAVSKKVTAKSSSAGEIRIKEMGNVSVTKSESSGGSVILE